MKNNQVDIGVRVELPAVVWEDFEKKIESFIKTDIPANINKTKMLELLRTRIDKLSDINDKMSFFITLPEYDKELFLNKKNMILQQKHKK